MRSKYPKIEFLYSFPYNTILAEYESKNFEKEEEKVLRAYIKKLQNKWKNLSNSVYQELESLTNNEWQGEEIKCYIVKYCKYSGFSDPLTIRYDPDFDYILDTLIHELIHIILSYDIGKYKKIEKRLRKQFPEENERIILHIYVVFVELQILRKFFKPFVVNKIIERGKKFKIKKAWEIVLNEEKELRNFLN